MNIHFNYEKNFIQRWLQNPGPGLRQAQHFGGVIPVNKIPTLTLLITGL